LKKRRRQSPEELPRRGTITKLTHVKRDPDRVSVYIDNTYVGTIYVDRIRELKLNVGSKLTEEGVEKLYHQIKITEGQYIAMNKLSYRHRSVAEIERELRKNRIPDEVIKEVIEYLTSRGYLNDAEFARAMVQTYTHRKVPFGRRAIRSKMIEKGIDRELIESTLNEIEDEDGLARKAADAGIKRYVRYDGKEKREKLAQFLYRKGYSWDTIKEVLDELIPHK